MYIDMTVHLEIGRLALLRLKMFSLISLYDQTTILVHRKMPPLLQVIAVLATTILFMYTISSSTASAANNIRGTPGDDIIVGTPDEDWISAAGGNDTARGLAGNDVIDGGIGNNNLTGDSGDDFITSSRGNDTIDGGPGRDEISGDKGNDILRGGSGRDVIFGGTGGDIIGGGNETDWLFGGPGSDLLTGGPGPDRFSCGMGMDRVLDFSEGDNAEGNCDEVVNADKPSIRGNTTSSDNATQILTPIPEAEPDNP